jgi:hypothetical protein
MVMDTDSFENNSVHVRRSKGRFVVPKLAVGMRYQTNMPKASGEFDRDH